MATTNEVRQGGTGRRRRLGLLVGSACLLLLAGAAGWWWLRPPVAAPPELPLSEFEPAVAALLEEERNKVLRSPRSAEAWGRLGKALLANGVEREADVCFAEAQRLDPAEPRWPYFRGLCLREHDPGAAAEQFRRATGLGRPRPGMRFLLADVLLAEDRLDEAKAELEALAQEGADPMRLRLLRGVLASRQGDWRACAEELAPLAEMPQARRQATLLLAAAYRRLGNAERAAEYARRARRLPADVGWDDPYAEEWLPLVRSLASKFAPFQGLGGRQPSAEDVQALVRLINETKGKDDRAFALLAASLANTGQVEKSERAARAGLAVRPDGRANLFALCAILLSRAERSRRERGAHGKADRAALEEAEALAERALGKNPNDAWMLTFRGRARFALGLREEGLADLRAAANCRPDLLAVQYNLSEALLEASRLGEARAALERARRLAPPDDPPVAELQRRLIEAEKKNGK